MDHIKLNKARCKKCGDILTSYHTHDYKVCSCGSLMVDGGLDYIRRGGHPEDHEELSEYSEVPVPHRSAPL